MKSLKQTYTIHAPLEKVWEALTNPKIIAKWCGGPAKMSDKKGKFFLWGGDIWGENIRVIPQKKLVQDWYGGDWDKPSHVAFDLSEKKGSTTVVVTQTNIPDEEFADIQQGWKDYYMEPLQNLLEEK